MNKNFRLDQKSLRLFYFRYKDTPEFVMSVSGVCIVVGIVLFFGFVVPQISSWFSIQQEVVATRDRVKTIKDNTVLMNAMSDSDLTNKVQIASNALPSEKDFTGILDALSSAARDAHVGLADYSFSLGQLSDDKKPEVATAKVDVALSAGFDAAGEFVKHLKEKTPLSDVTNIAVSGETATVTVLFYYQPYGQIPLDATQPILLVPAQKEVLLNTLQTWAQTSQ